MEGYRPGPQNGDFDAHLLADSVDNARFARGARWAVGIVAALIAASLASAILSLASVL